MHINGFIKIALLTITTLASTLFIGHDIHISKCDIKYNTEESSIQVSLRLYLDDLESSLKNDGFSELKILTKSESKLADSLLQDYVGKHLILSLDGNQTNLDYLGKEISEDFLAVWCYFEIPEIETLSQLDVTNNILHELYDDQQNIVTVKRNTKRRGYFLSSKGKDTESINLEQ